MEPTFLITAIFLWSLLGICFVCYLVFAEYVLKTICPFCTAVHVLNIIIAVFAFRMYSAQPKDRPSFVGLIRGMRAWILPCALLFLIPLIVFNVFDLARDSRKPSILAGAELNVESILDCLKLKGVKMYGSPGCSSCQDQKALIGAELFSRAVTFVNCDDEEKLCEKKNLKGYPTWIQERDNTELMRVDGVLEVLDLARDFGCDPHEKKAKKEISESSSTPPAGKDEDDADVDSDAKVGEKRQ